VTLAAVFACLAFARAQTPPQSEEPRGGESVRLYPVLVNFKTGFIDRTGKLVIEPKYDLNPSFGDGLAVVRSGLRPGLTPEEVEQTEPSGGMVAMPLKGKVKVEVIDTSGKTVAALPPGRDYMASFYSEGLASFSVWDEGAGRRYGYMDRTGRVVVEPQFSTAGLFQEGRAGVCVAEGRCGFIDREGRFVIRPRFKEVYAFSEGLTSFKTRDGLAGYMDKDGQVVIEPQFSQHAVGHFSEGLAAVAFKGSDRWGYIDRLGHFRIQPEFEWAGPFSEGLAPVRAGGKFGYIDRSGKFVIAPRFSVALDFSEGLAGASTCAGSLSPSYAEEVTRCGYGYIDRTGTLVVEEKFDLVMPFREGIAHVYERGARGYIDREGKYVWKPSR
jgi:hypothetical protein